MVDYENVHEAEASIARLESIFNKSAKFDARQYIDP